jgi:hypothetical protein
MPRKQLHVFMIDGTRLAAPEIIDWAEVGPYAFKKRTAGVKSMEAVLTPKGETAQHLSWSDQNYSSWSVLSGRRGSPSWWNPLDGADPRTRPVASPRRSRKYDVWL